MKALKQVVNSLTVFMDQHLTLKIATMWWNDTHKLLMVCFDDGTIIGIKKDGTFLNNK